MTVAKETIRVLVVDDSAFMRNRISMMLMKCADFTVVGSASDGFDAIEQVQHIQPDVMTLDVEMPGMNGLEVLDHVMAHHPLPVIMISGLTEEGAAVTLESLERGAVDFIAKPMNADQIEIGKIECLLHTKVREAFLLRERLSLLRQRNISRDECVKQVQQGLPDLDTTKTLEHSFGPCVSTTIRDSSKQTEFPLVVIGASTGGPTLLKALVRDVPSTFPGALLFVQHMPRYFTKVFAEQLNVVGSIPIREAQDGDVLRPGLGLVVPGNQHARVIRRGDGLAVLALSEEPKHDPYRPSIDRAMISAAEQFGSSTVGVVLTGMGEDGKRGSQAIKACGGTIIAQDEASSLIYGMPRAVVEAGLADRIVSDVNVCSTLIQAVDSRCVVTRL